MHEAGLARGVVAALRERGLRLTDVRLTVRGGHHEPGEFEAELREHLSAALAGDEAAVAALEIVRLPSGHFCPTCGSEFESPGVDEPCPNCRAETLAAVADEQIDIVPLEPAG